MTELPKSNNEPSQPDDDTENSSGIGLLNAVQLVIVGGGMLSQNVDEFTAMADSVSAAPSRRDQNPQRRRVIRNFVRAVSPAVTSIQKLAKAYDEMIELRQAEKRGEGNEEVAAATAETTAPSLRKSSRSAR